MNKTKKTECCEDCRRTYPVAQVYKDDTNKGWYCKNAACSCHIQLCNTPNKTTQEALKEGRNTMKTFETVEEMREDIEGYEFAPKQFAMKPMQKELNAVWSSKGYDEREEAMEKFHSKLHALMTATRKEAIDERDREFVDILKLAEKAISDNEILMKKYINRDGSFNLLRANIWGHRFIQAKEVVDIIKNKNQT